MILIIQILILFILISCILKLSFWKVWQALIFALVCVVFIIWISKFAILQSKTQLIELFENVKVMQNIAVLITIESAIGFAFCFTLLCGVFKEKNRVWVQLLYWYPGLLIFPALFYSLTQIIYIMPGINFNKISYGLAGGILVGLPALSYFISLICPNKELKLELYFLVTLFVCIAGLVSTVNGNVIYAAVDEPLNTGALLLSALFFAFTFLIGFLWHRKKWTFGHKRL